MKVLLSFLAVSLLGSASFATVDANTSIYIVVDSENDSGEYSVQQAPASFCVGIMTLALAEAITKPVLISKGYSCGNEGVVENTNALTCVVINAEEVWDGDKLKLNQVRLSTNLDGCGEKKDDKAFQAAVDSAIKKTYKLNGIKIVK